jgi:hypothetical protein
MKGQQVIVRGFDHKPAICRVWEVGEGVVYVVSDRQYRQLLAGQAAPFPIGFPVEDVFEYSLEVVSELTRPQDWSQLTRWKEQ